MPIADSFRHRLTATLPSIVERFGTPFHLYDEAGILQTGRRLNRLFGDVAGFREYFAVKALPNLRILDLLRRELGFGFDCSSIPELEMVRRIGARGNDIMFTSNNTSRAEYAAALEDGGAILNLDDVSFVEKVPEFPDRICFRYNPGEGVGTVVLGAPREAKFGLRPDQLEPAFRHARDRGARHFGLHMMLSTNELDWRTLRDSVQLLLAAGGTMIDRLGITLEFVNMGGGIGIPYRPGEPEFDLESFACAVRDAQEAFAARHGQRPKLLMECGRAITGPHGVMIAQAINVMSKYRNFVGVDASMSALMRPGMYPHAYNHITVLDRSGNERTGQPIFVDVVGSLCENNDKFAEQIALPAPREGDYLLFHDTGAHGHAMGFQYNGRLRPQELLLRESGAVERIRRAETIDDYLATQLDC
ncbi:MAG: diaminopimelate decarboxylase [Pseudomonadota bacterium]